MSDKEPMTWVDIIVGLISWCAGTEIINGMIAGFRIFFGGRHPEDWLHIQVGSCLAVLFGAMYVFGKLSPNHSDEKDSDSV